MESSPENFAKKTLFQSIQVSNTKEKEIASEEKTKIFNSAPTQPKTADEKLLDTSDDEWGAVPAFLRRSKLK